MKRQFLLFLIITIILLGLVGCGQRDGPDLVPERRIGGQGNEGFCNIVGDGDKLLVRVRNQGNEDISIDFLIKVEYFPGGMSFETINLLAQSDIVEVVFEVPASCFNSDCNFTITLDPNDDIRERNEANNTEDGICIG